MKLNIFQKIAFLVYISILLLICVYFVPYHGSQNHLGAMMENFKSDSSYHSNILDEGFGSMSYLRFIIYFSVPGVFFYFIFRYLEKMNSLEINVYKKKAKQELYIFFVFVSIIAGTVFFLYGNNEYSEIRKDTLKSEILKIENLLNKVEEELLIIPLPESNVDEFGIVKKKHPFDSNEAYEIVKKKSKSTSTKKEDVFKEGKEVVTDKDHDLIVSELRNYAKEGATDDELREFKYAFVKAIINKKRELNKQNFELKLKEILFYNKEELENNIILVFFGMFILLYIIRPLFSMFKGMLKEVR